MEDPAFLVAESGAAPAGAKDARYRDVRQPCLSCLPLSVPAASALGLDSKVIRYGFTLLLARMGAGAGHH